MERFLRILSYDQNPTVCDMAFQICKFQLNDASFLKFRPSQIAACSCIISINIYEEAEQNWKFFKFPPKDKGEGELNTSIWNNEKVSNITGYSIENLKTCLYDLCLFMRENLHPDRLVNFNLAVIKNITSSDQIPANVELDLFNLQWRFFLALVSLWL